MNYDKMSMEALRNVTCKQAIELAKRGKEDYNWYMTHALDVEPANLWTAPRKINDSVRDNERTAVGAGHGVSKTYNSARLALTFLMVWYKSIVITTAPTAQQVKDLTWRSLREAHANARVPMPGRLTETKLDLQPETGVQWYALGVATRPDTVTAEATKIQGYHSPVAALIIIEEGAGVLPEIWRAIEHIGAPYKRVLAIGNPTSSGGEFAAALKDPSWNRIQVSVRDTPNFKAGRTIIPGVYGREYELRIRTKYGADSDEYAVRVDGEISRKRHPGAYYASAFERLRKAGRICELPIDPYYPVHTVWDVGYTMAIWFFQQIATETMFIKYYEDSGLGMPGYIQYLKEWGQQESVLWGSDFVPCDVDSNSQKVVTNQTVLDVLKEHGRDPVVLKKERSVQSGIKRTEKFLARCWFDPREERCKVGLERAEGYHEKINKLMSSEDNPVFTGVPDQDGNQHGADALRYASKAVEQTGRAKMTTQEARDSWARHRAKRG